MKSDTPIDYAWLQLSPKRTRCEFFVSQSGNVERISSGLVKQFTTHLKVAEEKVVRPAQSIELKVDKRANGGGAWFTKGTLERFVQFVNTPEILEQINTYDAEISQLEAALKIYTEGLGDQSKNASGRDAAGAKAAADATKRELIRAIDVRLVTVKEDITSACLRASSAGFNPDTISDLQFFAEQFGSVRLKETCENLTTLWQRRPDLVKQTWQTKKKTAVTDDRAVRSSACSDMSIEDPTEDDNNPSPGPHHELLKPQEAEEIANKESSKTSSGPSSIQASQPSRRLSVQDRINLFENKQKETSGGKPASPALEKTVLRRLSSDVSSSTDKGVLRRWSGVSDMSIDLSGDKISESPVSTPLSEVSADKFPADSIKTQDSKSKDSESVKEEVDLKDQDQMRSKKVQFELRRQESLQERQKVSSVDESKDIPGSGKLASVDVKSGHETTKDTLLKKEEETGLGSRFGVNVNLRRTGDFQSKIRDSFVSHINSKSVVQQSERLDDIPVESSEGVRAKASTLGSTSFGRQIEVIEKRVLVSTTKTSREVEESDMQHIMFPDEGSSAARNNAGTHHNRKTVLSSKQVLETHEGTASLASTTSSDQIQRVRQSKGNQELNDELQLKANELEKLFAEHKLNVPGEQSASARRNKPSEMKVEHQEVNDELQLKANELEKLFAEHKLNVPGEQSASARRNKPSEMKVEHATNSRQKTPEPTPEPNSATVTKTGFLVESIGSSSTSLKSNSINSGLGKAFKDLPEVSASDSSKGKSYVRYMQKRDAKLREEWEINRAEKEAKMKAMLESLERSSSEMKAKFSGSTDKNDSVSGTRRQTEKFRSFNVRSSARREQPVDYFENEEIDEEFDSREQKPYGERRVPNEDSLPDAVSRSNQNKKLNRNVSASTPRTPGLPVSRSAVKANNLISGKRKTQQENPLAQSVPNFADFRNENSKPSGIAKTTPRSQPRNFARSRSSVDEAAAKDEKARRLHTLRKSYGTAVEFKDLSALNSDIDVLAPNKSSNKLESKTFLRKGNGIGPGAGSNLAKMKASIPSEVLKIEEESSELVSETEDYADMIKVEGVEEFDTKTEEYNDVDSEQVILKQENGDFSDPESGNDDAGRSLYQHDSNPEAELPATEPAVFQAMGSVQESPSESPLSWNARMHQSFSYPQESSDIEASVDSPMGSPASWNSHSMTQSESEAVRMRKKWGSAFVPNSSVGQSRKDMTKGFKRLLKFGRKSRGTETLVDWISATTSEGDDDTEDGRDPANRSSDDLRKSRMGFTPSHPSDDAFNESELYSEQVQSYQSIAAPNFKFREDHLSGSSLKAPRSFFSLSSFRSKGSESKPR
ncbi:unnamed protein product [Rhodiola kirilowii]